MPTMKFLANCVNDERFVKCFTNTFSSSIYLLSILIDVVLLKPHVHGDERSPEAAEPDDYQYTARRL